jgi:hypothetical protein
MGRDSYVKVVDRGFLFPYGHQAASISVTERRFRSVKGGKQRAYLAKRQFVIVRQPLRDYGGVGHPSDGRAFPFRSVRITTLITPDIQLEEGGIFVPRVLASGDPVLFDLVGVDWSGRETELDSPLTFVRADVKQNALASLTFGYNAKAPDDEATQRRRPVGGQKIAFAEEEQAGDTSFDVTHLLIGAQEALESKVNQLRKRGEATFFPLLQQTGLRLPAAEQLAGKLLGETLMELDPGFIKDGFDEVLNAGQVFLKMADSAPDLLLSFVDQADKAGGIATPDLSISGITRQLGPVGGLLDDLRKGDFDPATYLNQAAKLLGATKLLDILDKVPLGQGGGDGRAPHPDHPRAQASGAPAADHHHPRLGAQAQPQGRPPPHLRPPEGFEAGAERAAGHRPGCARRLHLRGEGRPAQLRPQPHRRRLDVVHDRRGQAAQVHGGAGQEARHRPRAGRDHLRR